MWAAEGKELASSEPVFVIFIWAKDTGKQLLKQHHLKGLTYRMLGHMTPMGMKFWKVVGLHFQKPEGWVAQGKIELYPYLLSSLPLAAHRIS